MVQRLAGGLQEQGVEEAMMHVADAPGGGSYVQLLRPLRDDSPVGKFLARNGEGVHHIGYGVDDVAAARATLEERGVVFGGDIFDTGVCHMAFFADPDGNALMLHHRYAPRAPRP